MKSMTTTNNLLEISGHNGPIYCIDADEKFIYSASSDTYVTRWLKSTGEQDRFAIKCNAVPYVLCLFAQHTKLAIGLSTGQIHIVDVMEKREIHHIVQHQSGIFALKELSSRNLLFVGDADGYLSVWDKNSMKLQLILPLNCGKIRCIESFNDQAIFVAGGNGEIVVIEVEFMNEIGRFYAHEGGTSSLYFDKQHQQLISGGKDAYLRWWEMPDFQLVKALPAHKANIYGIRKWKEDEFITVSRDKSMKRWNLTSKSVLEKWESSKIKHRQSINSLWSNENGQFAFAGDDKIIHFYSSNAEDSLHCP